MLAATRPPASVVAATLRATGGPGQLAQVEQRVSVGAVDSLSSPIGWPQTSHAS